MTVGAWHLPSRELSMGDGHAHDGAGGWAATCDDRCMDLPRVGRPIDDVIDDLTAKRGRDARWHEGRTFGLVYDGGESVHEVAERAAALYLHENALNTNAFPSLASIQNEVVAWTAALLHAPDS